MSGILVAGLGNIFKGDDGFGVEVAQRMTRLPVPPGVAVIDFGIRGIDLTYALLDGYDAAVIVDTARRGGRPGDIHIIEPEPLAGEPEPGDLLISAHDLDPAKVLRLVAALGGQCRRVLVVGCEPLTFGDEDEGAMGLSPPVTAAVDTAIGVIEGLIRDIRQGMLAREVVQ